MFSLQIFTLVQRFSSKVDNKGVTIVFPDSQGFVMRCWIGSVFQLIGFSNLNNKIANKTK